MPPVTLPLRPDAPPLTLDVSPGGEIILRGSYTSTHDASNVDAATTTWPAGAPGGASIDPGGLVDLTAGGFHLTSRDPVTHEVHAIATGEPGPACAAVGATYCLPLRLREGARGRLLTGGDWARSLKGAITVDVVAPPVYAPAASAARDAAPWLAAGGSVLGLALGAVTLWKLHKRRASSPRAQLLALARQVQDKARRADPILAAPLAPALAGALRRLEAGDIDPSTTEGLRVRSMLQRVDTRLDEASHHAKSQREQELADELAQDVELAFEAAQEARLAGDLPHPLPAPQGGGVRRQVGGERLHRGPGARPHRGQRVRRVTRRCPVSVARWARCHRLSLFGPLPLRRRGRMGGVSPGILPRLAASVLRRSS